MEALHLEDLHKSFGDNHVLRGMTFTVHPGELYGFVGANGSGKSTTMRIALGVLAADSGHVRIGNTPINDTLRRRIGYMPEERGLYAKEKIADQLIFFARLHGLDKKYARSSAMQLLERLGLAERAEDKLEALSLGNQQRVQLAASLIHNPDLLILDEPFSGLDPVAVGVMSELLVEKTADGVPVLFSSHQLDLVQRLCDRVGIVGDGALIAEGSVTELRSRGPVVFEVLTPATGWYPPTAQVIKQWEGGVLLQVGSTQEDQKILQAALAAGPVHSFRRRIPDLNELFQEVMQEEAA